MALALPAQGPPEALQRSNRNDSDNAYKKELLSGGRRRGRGGLLRRARRAGLARGLGLARRGGGCVAARATGSGAPGDCRVGRGRRRGDRDAFVGGFPAVFLSFAADTDFFSA